MKNSFSQLSVACLLPFTSFQLSSIHRRCSWDLIFPSCKEEPFFHSLLSSTHSLTHIYFFSFLSPRAYHPVFRIHSSSVTLSRPSCGHCHQKSSSHSCSTLLLPLLLALFLFFSLPIDSLIGRLLSSPLHVTLCPLRGEEKTTTTSTTIHTTTYSIWRRQRKRERE